MADSRNLCEEIEIAIYSDTELTEEQKKHIENCESCKALLSQVSQMKNDLGALSVPGIVEGSIVKSVMDSIKAQKTSRALPRFRITHHLGTAAAVVIILAAALIIKNPADITDEKSLSYDNISSETQQVEEENTNMHTLSVPHDDTAVVAEENSASDGADSEAPVKFKSVRPESAGTTEAQSQEETVTEDVASEDAPMLMFKTPLPRNSAAEGENALSYNVATETNEAALFADEEESQSPDYNVFDSYSYSSGGGGGSSARSTKIFAMEDFGDDLYENIEIANRIFFELSGIPDYFKAENFESNEDFLKAIENFTFTLEN